MSDHILILPETDRNVCPPKEKKEHPSTMPADSRPIGVFDSGIGGLTILREMWRELPDERFIYFGDDAHCPYGPRPEREVIALALASARWLVARDVKAIVVACNAASVSARDALRAAFPDIPIVVVVPAVKPAAALTRTGTVILAATARAINDRFTHHLIGEFATGVRVIPVACPALVELVESGRLTGPEPEAALREYLGPALAQGADVVVLGCTHFPALRSAVEAVVGPHVAVIDSGAAVARQTRHVIRIGPTPGPSPSADGEGSLVHAGGLRGGTPIGAVSTARRLTTNTEFWTSGEPERFARVASMVLGQPVVARHALTDVRWEEGGDV
jgi:glutamate racemase